MKKTVKILIPLLALILIAALCAIPSAAADNVIFICDGATGDGSGADSPLKPTTGNYDPLNSNPACQKDTALYQAWQKLMALGGGTIVFCGPYTIDRATGQGTSANTKDFMISDRSTYKPNVTITYTSVYNGVDYRETNGAMFIFGEAVHFICPTASVFENITVKAAVTGRTLCGGGNPLELRTGTNFLPVSASAASDASSYVTVIGAERYKTFEGTTNVVVDIGNENTVGSVFGGQMGAGSKYPFVGNTHVTVKSGTVIGDIGGTCSANSTHVDGNAFVTLEGGIFKGKIYAVGKGGFADTDGNATVTVSGGDFTGCAGILASSGGFTGNPPAHTVLDLSSLASSSAKIVKGIASGFSEIEEGAETKYSKYDLNRDRLVDEADAGALLTSIVGDADAETMDFNEDESVNALDAILLVNAVQTLPTTVSEYFRMNCYASERYLDDTLNDAVVAMLGCAEYYNDVLLEAVRNGEKWVYSNDNTVVRQSGTFEQMINDATRGPGANCALISNWAFQDIGIVPEKGKFFGYSDDTIHGYHSTVNGKTYKTEIDAACTVLDLISEKKTFKQLYEEGRVKPGDTFFLHGHTFFFGNDLFYASGHDAIWHEDLTAVTEDTRHAVFDNFKVELKKCADYTEKNKTINFIFRVKDSFVPTMFRDRTGSLVKFPTKADLFNFIASYE